MAEDFIIPLNGLKPGRTGFSWHAGKEFFNRFENAEIIGADIAVDVEVEKSGTYLGVDCGLHGTLTVPCDRCLEDVVVPISSESGFSVKFGDEPVLTEETVNGDEREVIYLPDEGTDLDMSQIVYDFACLSLPMQRVHEEGKCNQETLKYLDRGVFSAPSETGKAEEEDAGRDMYNPFAVLKGLKLDE